jgi:hypothetical protein
MDRDTTRQQIQVSSRLNVIRKPWETTGVHVGYARCLVAPAFELVSTVTISDLADTAAAPISATTIRSTSSAPIPTLARHDSGFRRTILAGVIQRFGPRQESPFVRTATAVT